MQPFENLTLYYPLGWSMYVLCSMEYMAPSISCWWWSLIKYYSKSAHFWSKSVSTKGWFVFNEISFTLFLYKSNFCFVTPFSGAASTVESKFEGGWLKPRGRRAVNGGAPTTRSRHCAAGDCLNPILSLSPTPEPSSPKHTASPSNTADPQMKTLVSSWGFAAPPFWDWGGKLLGATQWRSKWVHKSFHTTWANLESRSFKMRIFHIW